MIERILTVGGYTLLSRVTGFMRDIMLPAAGPPQRQPANAIDITARIGRRQVLSGLISEYRRAA